MIVKQKIYKRSTNHYKQKIYKRSTNHYWGGPAQPRAAHLFLPRALEHSGKPVNRQQQLRKEQKRLNEKEPPDEKGLRNEEH